MGSLPTISMALQMRSHVVSLGITGCFSPTSTTLPMTNESSCIVDGPELSDVPPNVAEGFPTAGVLAVILFCLGPMVALQWLHLNGINKNNIGLSSYMN